MHQIHRRIGFEKIAPGSFSGMRFARDEKNTQLVSYTFDAHARPIVDLSQFVCDRRGFDFDDVPAAMENWNRDALRHPDRNAARLQGVPIAADRHLRRLLAGAVVLDAISDGLPLTDNAEARCGYQRNATVAFIPMSGDQRMDRRG